MKTILGVALLTFACVAQAQQLKQKECDALSLWAADMVWARDMGASKEKIRAYFQSQKDVHFLILLRKFDELWDIHEQTWEEVAESIQNECYAKRGNYGTPS